MHIPSKVLITGAQGFIGSALAARLRALGTRVVGVDLQANPALDIHAGNVAESGDWQKRASGCEWVIHTAAVVSNAAPARLYREVSVGSVRHAIDAAIGGGASRFLHVSSIAAYGLDFVTERKETDAISALSAYPYCDAKAASEHAALAAHSNGEMACTIVRPGDVYGPGSRPWVLIPLALMKKRQFLLPASGRGLFSPVYIDNLLDGMLLAASSPHGAGKIYNLTDGESVSCADFFAHHWRWAGKTSAIPQLPTPVAHSVTVAGEWFLGKILRQNTEISVASLAMLSRHAGYSIEKARSELGYQPQVTLSQGMQLTEQWLRENRLI